MSLDLSLLELGASAWHCHGVQRGPITTAPFTSEEVNWSSLSALVAAGSDNSASSSSGATEDRGKSQG